MRLDPEGNVVKCDWCGAVKDYSHIAGSCELCGCDVCKDLEKTHDLKWSYWRELFKIPGSHTPRGILLPPDFPGDLCFSCACELTPWVQRFADIKLVESMVNYLGRAINDKRKNRRTADNGPIADYARQCCEGRP